MAKGLAPGQLAVKWPEASEALTRTPPPIAWGHVGPWGPYAPRWRARQRDRGVPPLRPGRDPSFTLISHSVSPGPVVTRSLTRVAVGEQMTFCSPVTTLQSDWRSSHVSSAFRVRRNQPSDDGAH